MPLATASNQHRGVPRAFQVGLSVRWLAGALCLLFLTGLLTDVSYAADPAIDVQLASRRVSEGGSVIMTVSLSGFSKRASDPVVPASNGFTVYETGTSSNFSWVNGKMSSSKIYTFEIEARKAGTYVVGPVTVDDQGRSYRASPVEIEVIAAAAPSPAGAGAQRQSQDADPGRLTADDKDLGLFVRTEVDKYDPYVDEQITLRFQLFQRADIRLTDIGEFSPPSTEGFWREDLGPQSEYEVNYEGERYHVREVAWALFPTQAGAIEIGPGSVVCSIPTTSRNRQRGVFDFGFFNRESVPLRSRPLKITAKQLPETGRRSSFSGSVGSYAMTAAFDVQEAVQGEPLTLNVNIKGTGHIQTIGAPAWPAWDGLRVYDSGESVESRRNNDKVVGGKTFSQVMVPYQAGEITLEPIEFQYFDPQRGSYQTRTSPPLKINVAPARAVPGGMGREDVVALGEDILYIRQNIVSGIRNAAAGAFAWHWLLHLIPLGLLGAGYWLRGRRLVLERNPVLARRSRAMSKATAALAAISLDGTVAQIGGELAELTESYLSAWLDSEVRGMRRQDLAGELSEIGLESGLIDQVLALLAWADEVRFGAAGEGGTERRIGDCRTMIGALEQALRATKPGRLL